MKTKIQRLILISMCAVFIGNTAHSQSPAKDSVPHIYKINYWVTIPFCAAATVADALSIKRIKDKKSMTDADFQTLNKNSFNSIDRWAFKQDPSKRNNYENYSHYTLTTIVALPLLFGFDKTISKDFVNLILMLYETHSIVFSIYNYGFLGPTFQNRYRPVVYYDQLTHDQRRSGGNLSSFYSGHVASAAASTFFMVKVYSDYHPEIGANKYLLYGAASIPPLFLGYLRVKALKHFPSDVMVGFGLGAICGIIVPELHRIKNKKRSISLGLYSTGDANGLTLTWNPSVKN
ncbi:MAG: phosphatase PAP2 family protein [Bacteroidales bacterium]|jgi:membrane-associated phospholipid phosphatase